MPPLKAEDYIKKIQIMRMNKTGRLLPRTGRGVLFLFCNEYVFRVGLPAPGGRVNGED